MADIRDEAEDMVKAKMGRVVTPQSLGHVIGMIEEEKRAAATKDFTLTDDESESLGTVLAFVVGVGTAVWLAIEACKLAWSLRDEFAVAAFGACASAAVIHKVASRFNWDDDDMVKAYSIAGGGGAVVGAILAKRQGLPDGAIISGFFDHIATIGVGAGLASILYTLAKDTFKQKLGWKTAAKVIAGVATIGIFASLPQGKPVPEKVQAPKDSVAVVQHFPERKVIGKHPHHRRNHYAQAPLYLRSVEGAYTP